MLYVNDELVKPGSTAHDKFKKFKEEVLPRLQDPVVFKTGDPIRFNESGLPEAPRSEMIPLDHSIMGEDGGEHWRYCDRPPKKKADGNFTYSPRRKVMKNHWKFNKQRDAEQIFFFYEISPFRDKGRIIFEDKERDARRSLEKETSDLDVRWTITSSKSPISVEESGSEDTMRMIAAAWGIPDAHTNKYSISEIKLSLLSAVQQSNKNYSATQRGYKEFLKEAEELDRTSSMANVQKAIDTGVIVYDKSTFSWRFVVSNTPLATIPARDAPDPVRALNKFLSLNEKSAKILELSMRDAYVSDTPEEPEGDLTIAKVEKMSYPELKKTAGILELDTRGKQEELRKRIIKELSSALA